MQKIFIVSFMFALLIGVVSTQAVAQSRYGAISYSAGDRVHGFSNNFRSRRSAERRALFECRRRGGRSCRVAIWFKNACGALAIGPNGYGSGWGTSLRIARGHALRSCRGYSRRCRVIRWVCTR